MTVDKVLIDEQMTEAAEWRLLGLLFDCPSDKWRREVSGLANEVGDPELAETARLAAAQGSEGLFHSTFGPGGPAPGREVSYRSWVQPGYMLSEITAFFKAFAFSPDTRETPDHVSVEASFVSYLKLKRAFALANEDAEKAEVAAQAEAAFVTCHLAKYAEPLSRALLESGVEYLSRAGQALFQRVGSDPDAAGKRTILPVFPAEDEDFDCGTGG